MKEGYKTSEFWITTIATVLANVFGILMAVGQINKADSDHLQEVLNYGVAGAIAVVSSVFVVVQYIKGRVELKKETPAESSTSNNTNVLPMLLVTGLALLWAGTAPAQVPPSAVQMQNQLMFQQNQLLQKIVAQQEQIITLLAPKPVAPVPATPVLPVAPVAPSIPSVPRLMPPETPMSFEAVPQVMEASYDANGKLMYYIIISKQPEAPQLRK